jgi:hypothetical protein
MTMTDARLLGAAEATFIAAVRSDDTARFALITERHRRELQVHCYRMLANYEDSQDLTQETFGAMNCGSRRRHAGATEGMASRGRDRPRTRW